MRGETPPDGWWPERIQTLLGRLVEEGPYISAEQALAYAPYVVRFPLADAGAPPPGAPQPTAPAPAEAALSPEPDTSLARTPGPASPVADEPAIPSPAVESLTEARERLGLPLGQVPRLGGRR